MFRLILITLFCIPILCQAQSLSLKNGNKNKIFPAETYYHFIFGESNDPCCQTNILGKVTRLYKDSVQIRVSRITLSNADVDFLMTLNGNIYDQNFNYTLPKSEFIMLSPYKSTKQANRNNSWIGFGWTLFGTGLVTLANSYDLNDKEFRPGVLLASGIQIVGGFTVLISSKKKKYKASDGWTF